MKYSTFYPHNILRMPTKKLTYLPTNHTTDPYYPHSRYPTEDSHPYQPKTIKITLPTVKPIPNPINQPHQRYQRNSQTSPIYTATPNTQSTPSRPDISMNSIIAMDTARWTQNQWDQDQKEAENHLETKTPQKITNKRIKKTLWGQAPKK